MKLSLALAVMTLFGCSEDAYQVQRLAGSRQPPPSPGGPATTLLVQREALGQVTPTYLDPYANQAAPFLGADVLVSIGQLPDGAYLVKVHGSETWPSHSSVYLEVVRDEAGWRIRTCWAAHSTDVVDGSPPWLPIDRALFVVASDAGDETLAADFEIVAAGWPEIRGAIVCKPAALEPALRATALDFYVANCFGVTAQQDMASAGR